VAITFINAAKSPTSYPGASNNTGTCTVAKPTNTASGDVMLALFQAGSGVVLSDPGWSLIGLLDNGSNMKSWAYYKVAGGSEPSNYTWTADDAGTPLHGYILTFRGCDTSASPIDAYNTGSTTTTDPATTPSVTTTHTLCVMVHAAFSRTTNNVSTQGTYTNQSGQTERVASGNRGTSTEYFGEATTDSSLTHVSPGSQAGKTFDADTNHAPSNGIQWQIALKSTVPTTSADAGSATATVAAYSAASLTVSTTATYGAVTATANNATVLTGVAAENTGRAQATATAYNAAGWVIHPVDAGAIAFNATVAIGTEAETAQVSVTLSGGHGYFGAPESRRWRIPAEDRTWRVARESRAWTIPAEDRSWRIPSED
jgi:hypothetical protein